VGCPHLPGRVARTALSAGAGDKLVVSDMGLGSPYHYKRSLGMESVRVCGVHCSSCRSFGTAPDIALKLPKKRTGNSSTAQTQIYELLLVFPRQHGSNIQPVLCSSSPSLSLWLLAFPDSHGRSRSHPADPRQRALPPARPPHPEPPDQHHLLCLRDLHPAASPLWSQVGQMQEMGHVTKQFVDEVTRSSTTSLL